MQETLKQETPNRKMTGIVRRINYFNYVETEYPLVDIIDFESAKVPAAFHSHFGLFWISTSHPEEKSGMLSFFSPGQMQHLQHKVGAGQLSGKALIFHPSILAGTSLALYIKNYSFFKCESIRALHLSRPEYQIVLDCFSNIKAELRGPSDEHSKRLIASNLELCLNYCERFYNRTGINPQQSNRGVLASFDKSLTSYLSSEKPFHYGVPSVAYCAEELHLSANYFGNLVKKETGKTALEYIHEKIVEEAKYRITDHSKTINEIAYELGFRYPQHFSRLFKKMVGKSPMEYRKVRCTLNYD